MFGIKPVEVEHIQAMYQNPKERLYHIILAFLRQAEPPPTWRAIVNALSSKTVNLKALAKRVEAAHFPDPTASRGPPTTSGESVTDVSNTQFTVVSTLVQYKMLHHSFQQSPLHTSYQLYLVSLYTPTFYLWCMDMLDSF